MYKLNKVIKDLKPDFFVNKDGDMLYSLKNENKLFFNDNVVYSGGNFSFKLFNKSIFIIKTDEKIFINEDIKKSIKIDVGFFIVDEFNVLFNIYSSDYSKQYYKFYNFIEEKEYWTIEKYFGIFIKDKNNLYASGIFDDNTIYKINLTHPEQPLWQFDLSELGTFQDYNNTTQNYKVEKIIGVHKNELLVACNNHCILSINIETGKTLHNFSLKELDLYNEGKDYPIARGFVYDAKTEKMFSFYGWYYIEIDINTRKIEFIDVKSSLIHYDIIAFRASTDYAFNDTHIFTIAERDTHKLKINWMQRSLISFNRKTKEIDWQYVFETSSINTDIPKLSGNKLYQLDAEGTLHIFEKTNNATT